jgi:hypothetical protein
VPDSKNTSVARRPEPEVRRLALTPNEAAASIGCSRDFFDEHIAHELRWLRRGRLKFVAVVELEAPTVIANLRRQEGQRERVSEADVA